MTEMQVLFHNPESLSDADLRAVRQKLRFHNFMQLGMGGVATLGAMRFTRCNMTLAGVFVGSYIASDFLARCFNNTLPWALSEPRDQQIIRAFDQRYVNKTLNL